MKESIPLVAAALAVACSKPGKSSRAAASGTSGAATEPGGPLDRASARHVLGRLAFGPAPGDVERLSARGLGPWLDEQLAAPASGTAVRGEYRAALGKPGDVAEEFAKKMKDDDGVVDRVAGRQGAVKALDFKRFIETAELAFLSAHVESSAQLREVMVAFWIDHFNVFAPKGATKLYGVDFVERALRPHALGSFEELLLATARHPAMLVYLDNASSVAAPMDPDDTPRGKKGRKKQGKKGKPGTAQPAKPSRGLNENYARELLELHTLGVSGGYTQKDVIEVARILTGWGLAKDVDQGLEFHGNAHDRGEKTVLGQTFPAGGGEDEGKRLIAFLATHPSTAKHIARKLCVRFVADEPPAACVDAAASAFLESKGRIDRTVRAIAQHPAFLDPENRKQKLKTPLEYLVSSLRALGGKADGSVALSKALARLGQPLLRQAVPTGYPEVTARWATGGRMLSRLQLATALAQGKLEGATLDLASAIPASVAADAIPAHLLDAPSAELTTAVKNALASTRDEADKRTLALTITLGSPDFQAQ
jgi:uncharacterized protein (DUF1800 family)